MKNLFSRIFTTNPVTSFGGSIAAVAVALLTTKTIDVQAFLALIGSAVSLIGLAAKDGVRSNEPVAREDVPAN